MQDVCFGSGESTTAADEPTDRRANLTKLVRPNPTLDEVDLGRQVARDLEANFLLANFGLRPNLHDGFLHAVNCFPSCKPRRGPTRLVQTLVVRAQSADRPAKVKRGRRRLLRDHVSHLCFKSMRITSLCGAVRRGECLP